MGYACPVCSDPQADAGHLANHLAFSALLGDDDHESWLDEHAVGWGRMGESELADLVAERVDRTEFPQLFEDTVGGLENGSDDPPSERSGALFDEDGDHHGHSHAHGHRRGRDHEHDIGHERGQTPTAPELDEPVDTTDRMDRETADILEEAREMTRRMHDDDSDRDGSDHDE